MSGDLRRVEARDEKQGQELPVVRLQVRKRALEVDQLDRICRVATRGTIRRVRDVEDGPASLPTEGLTRFIGGDRDQPRPDLTRVAQRWEAPPGDRPCGLDGVARRIGVPTDDERDR